MVVLARRTGSPIQNLCAARTRKKAKHVTLLLQSVERVKAASQLAHLRVGNMPFPLDVELRYGSERYL